MKKITVAIDGPAGAGKSSAAKMAAKALHYLYIDTGAMYRAFTWASLQNHVSIDDETAVRDLAKNIEIRLEPAPEGCRVFVGNQEVTEEIRTLAVSSRVSSVAALAVVREKLVQLQRNMASSGGVILDGRDIGTVVLPKADLKVFLTASVQSRAQRRYLEMKEKVVRRRWKKSKRISGPAMKWIRAGRFHPFAVQMMPFYWIIVK